jgi:hypothetical protein
VFEAVTSDMVPRGNDVTNECGLGARQTAHDKEGRTMTVMSELLENAIETLADPAGER